MRRLIPILVTLSLLACGGNSESDESIDMFKSLGTTQCAGGGTTVDALQAELAAAGVEVRATSCGNDGVSYPAACSASDGAIAIFEVPVSQQSAAEALLYAPLSTAPGATRHTCS